MGGITLHVWAAAIFFRPVEEHMKRVPIEVDEDEEDQIHCEEDITYETFEELSENSPENDKFPTTPPELSRSPNNLVQSPIIIKFNQENNVTLESSGESTPSSVANGVSKSSGEEAGDSLAAGLQPNGGFGRSVSAAVVQNLNRGSDYERKRKVSMPSAGGRYVPRINSKNMLTNSNSRSNMRSTPSLGLQSVPEGKYHLGSTEAFTSRRTVSSNRTPKRSPSTSSFQYMSTPFHGSTLSAFAQPDEFASQLTLQSVKDSFSPITSCCGLCKSKKDPKTPDKPKERSKFFDITLLKDPIYLVILISNCTNAISYTNFIILLPSYAINMGFDKSRAAYLLSIVSAFDLCGRIGGSALSDMGLIPKTWYFVGGLFISGASLAALPLVTTYGTISVCCAIFGLAAGTYVGVTAIIMAELLGMERLTSTYGISLFVNGIMQLIGPPLCGLWFESSGSYSAIFSTLGMVTVCGASIWGIMPYLHRRKARKLLEKEREINLKSAPKV